MYKKIIVLLLLVLMGCGGGGGADEYQPPALTQEQEDAIISGAQGAMDHINKPITDYCRDNPLSTSPLCHKDTTAYIGFTESDFSGKTLYFVGLNTYAKAEYTADGKVKAYYPGEDTRYEDGLWHIYLGKLFVARAATLSVQTVYTMISDDEANRYSKTSQKWADGTVRTIGIFYDQTTGESQAKDFVAEHRIP